MINCSLNQLIIAGKICQLIVDYSTQRSNCYWLCVGLSWLVKIIIILLILILCSVFSITIVLWDSSNFSSLVYFIILGCIGGMGILLGVCIVVRFRIFFCSIWVTFASKQSICTHAYMFIVLWASLLTFIFTIQST